MYATNIDFVEKKCRINTGNIGHYRAGITVLVLHGQEAEIGFYVKDSMKWQNTITGIIK